VARRRRHRRPAVPYPSPPRPRRRPGSAGGRAAWSVLASGAIAWDAPASIGSPCPKTGPLERDPRELSGARVGCLPAPSLRSPVPTTRDARRPELCPIRSVQVGARRRPRGASGLHSLPSSPAPAGSIISGRPASPAPPTNPARSGVRARGPPCLRG